MAMQFYASPEQVQRDRSEYARKGIARGRSAVVLTYEGGILLVAENITTLRKISEIYDKIGFAAVGRYNEFENLRRAGVRMADLNGYSYDRRDVTGRGAGQRVHPDAGCDLLRDAEAVRGGDLRRAGRRLAGDRRALPDHLRRFGDGRAGLHGDGRPGRGHLQRAARAARRRGRPDRARWPWPSRRWAASAGRTASPAQLSAEQLEVAVLDRRRKGRTFRRITGAALTTLLEGGEDVPEKELGDADAAPPRAAPRTSRRCRPPRSTSRADDEPATANGRPATAEGRSPTSAARQGPSVSGAAAATSAALSRYQPTVALSPAVKSTRGR